MSANRIDVLAVLDMALTYVEETHKIHPEDFKPGVGKRNVRDVRFARDIIAELIEAIKSEREYRADLAGTRIASPSQYTKLAKAVERTNAALASVTPELTKDSP